MVLKGSKKGFKRSGGDSYAKLEWRSDAKISEDGFKVTYRETGLFGPKDREYRVR